MNKNKRVSRIMLLGVAILVGGVLAGGFVVGSAQAVGQAQPPPPIGKSVWPGYGGMMGGGYGGMMGGGYGGMMGGRGGWGSGCGGYGGMMMGGFGYGYGGPAVAEPLTLDEAVEATEVYIAAYGDPDLALAEVMEFSRNFYAEVEEESTGVHAFELLINRYTGAVYPEMGPNMMWNTKYSPMAGMMGGIMGGWWGGTPGGEMTVTPAQARQYAQQFLETSLPGTSVNEEADAFYGYYTLHVLRDGQIVGMLSVNGTSGRVWYHTWHGDFIGMAEGHD
ncbi:MAG: hypothetical protein V3S00_03800 [Dehalococcoidia bacterium]